MLNLDVTNATAAELHRAWLPNPPGENDLDAAMKALDAARAGYPSTGRVWRTAQLADGRICGCFADSIEDAALTTAFWWGVDVAWIVDDPDCLIHARYRATVLVKDHQTARWPVTSAPVDHPVPVGVAEPEAVQVALFNMGEVS